MRHNRKKVVITGLVLAAILVGALLLFDQQNVEPPVITSSLKIEDDDEGAAKSNAEVGETEQPSLTPDELLDANPKLQKIKQIQQAANRQMDFYGHVVDQHGDPVAGAEVAYRYAYYPDTTLPTFSWSVRNDVTTTNALGKFQIETARGVHLTIADIRKPGYAVQASQVFQYRPRTVDDVPFASDPANPVIFQAWKKTEVARELKRGEERFNNPANGEPYLIVLPETGKTVTIAFTHHDEKTTDENHGKRRWSAKIRVQNGGVIESDDAFMYEAPENGYQPEWEIAAGENDYLRKNFYLKANDGKVYGRLQVELGGYYGRNEDKGFIQYSYVLNPTGSRNLLSEKD